MKLSKALLDLKNMKSQLKKANEYIMESVSHLEDETPAYSFTKEIAKMTDLQLAADELKVKIQKTNNNTMVRADVGLLAGKEATLAEAILYNSTVRSQLAFYQRLLGVNISPVRSHFRGPVTHDTVREVFAEGYDKNEIREGIAGLEELKSELDDLISRTNMSTNLM